MHIGVISLFPEMFGAISEYGVVGRAIQAGKARVSYWNPRDFTHDKHQTVDDRPYGGGPGMLMKVEPLRAAIQAAKAALPAAPVVYLSPQGQLLQQGLLAEHKQRDLILLCGRYEGIDERLLALDIDAEWSLGDFVLSGGEVAAMAVIDASVRLLPGVLGSDASAAQDSFVDGLLDCPHYTRPEILAGQPVPAVLLSGNHAEISRWRKKQALGRTWLRRPDLLNSLQLDAGQQALLAEFRRETGLTDDAPP